MTTPEERPPTNKTAQIVRELAPIIVAILAAIQATRAHEQTIVTHQAVNSRMDEMIKLVRKQAADEATLEEKKAEVLRNLPMPRLTMPIK